MKRKNYWECTSISQLMKMVEQNVIIAITKEKGIISSMDDKGYLKRETLTNALKNESKRKQVDRALFELCRYLWEKEPDLFSLMEHIASIEMALALTVTGREMNIKEKKNYGQNLPKHRH